MLIHLKPRNLEAALWGLALHTSGAEILGINTQLETAERPGGCVERVLLPEPGVPITQRIKPCFKGLGHSNLPRLLAYSEKVSRTGFGKRLKM